MEEFPEKKFSTEDFEKFLEVRLAGVTEKDLRKKCYLVFAVTEGFNIVIGTKGHVKLMEHGVDISRTLTEGNIDVEADGKIWIFLKDDTYQQYPQFGETRDVRPEFREAVRRKILSYIQKVRKTS